jgi:hypothetical protein
MPKIKMLQSFTGAIDGHYNPRAGDVIEVSFPAALDLVTNGYAAKVEPKKKTAQKKQTRKVEAATAAPPESAMRAKAQPRDG